MSEAVSLPADISSRPMVPAKGVAFVRAWLLLIAGMVYLMILVGGATRLTDSGLSMTDWDPLHPFPPLSETEWAEEFANYKAKTLQATVVNPDMTVEGFKGIFWWEWGHRQMGRVIGVVFIAGFLFFWLTGRTTKKLMPHLLGLFALGGLQAFIGWWMVSSGVGKTDLVSVAPYRLMTHFGLALLIIAYCFWLWLELGAERREMTAQARPWVNAIIWVTGIQMLLGALVAGLDAGRGYTDWPLMAGHVVPEQIWALDPVWRNLFENEATTQFFHRITAYGLLGVATWCAWRFRAQHWSLFPLFGGLAAAQAVLGIATLMHAAPLDMSLTHQGLGVILVLAATRLAWTSRGVS